MRVFDLRRDDLRVLQEAFDARLAPSSDAAEAIVREILDDVRKRGDDALRDWTRRWDCPTIEHLRVPLAAIDAATERVQQTELWPVLTAAAERIRAFHEKQRRTTWMDTSQPGEMLGQIVRPLRRAGVYVPGGTAAYPSTVLMAAIPALVAGVASVALTTPPQAESGFPPDATLAAARIARVHEVYALGGAQAIAALAYGTPSIERVDKIVGPGNVYVNLAKRLVYGTVGIDMLAGPSEVAVLADETADPAAAAAEVLAQCEHDKNCSALIVTTSESLIARVQAELEDQMRTLPRAEIARAALDAHSFFVFAPTLEEAAAVVNRYAPEHLHLLTENPLSLLGRIENAGAILIGKWTTAPIGDYLAGPSHTLPTAGCARFASPLNVDDFVKKTSVLYFDRDASKALASTAATFARFEGLTAHERAALRPLSDEENVYNQG